MWRVLYSILMVEGSVNYKKEAMRGFILHQPNPPCRDVDTNKLIPCTVTGQDDYGRLVSVNSANPSPPGQLKINCKGGSNNMTCLPLSLTPVGYFCACVSEKRDLNTEIGWNTWEVTTGPELTIKRSLCDSQAGWCLNGMFVKNLVYLVKTYAPLDSQISVSSALNFGHDAEKVRLEYNGEACAWIRTTSDNSPWVKFDFLQNCVAVGVKIGKRCDNNHGEQYVTSFHVSSSADDVTWSNIGTDVQAVYEGIIATWWFDMDVSARYWRIEPVNYVLYPSMQADIMGYI